MIKSMSKIFLIFLLMGIFSYSISLAQTEPISNKFIGYDDYVEEILKEWKVPGAAIAVVRNGEVIYSKGYGLRDVENKLPVTTKTLFGIGSITKQFAAASIGILQDEGKVHLDSPLVNYVSGFELYDKCVMKQITLRDLLSHRSGLSGNYWILMIKERKKFLQALRTEIPTRGFRESYQYNSFNYVVAASILEDITGNRWEDYVKEKIFTPLKMNKSCFTYTAAKLDSDCSKAYLVKDDGIMQNEIIDNPVWGPSGLMFSNIEEMSNWMIAFLNRGKFEQNQFISERFINEMTKPNISHELNPRFDEMIATYGLGLHTTFYQGNMIWYHVGAYDGFLSHILMHPDTKTGIIVLTNLQDPRIVSALSFRAFEQLMDLKQIDWKSKIRKISKERLEFLDKVKKDNLKKKQPNARMTYALDEYSGKYYNDLYGELSIVQQDDSLRVKFGDINELLCPYQTDVFETNEKLWNAKMKFIIKTGGIFGLSVDYNSSSGPIIFKKLK